MLRAKLFLTKETLSQGLAIDATFFMLTPTCIIHFLTRMLQGATPTIVEVKVLPM